MPDASLLQVLDAALSAQTVGLVTQEQYKRKLAQLQEEGVPTEVPKVSTCCLGAIPPGHMWAVGCGSAPAAHHSVSSTITHPVSISCQCKHHRPGLLRMAVICLLACNVRQVWGVLPPFSAPILPGTDVSQCAQCRVRRRR